MNTYTSTKESGIDWIGTIPTTWKTHTLYQLVTRVKNKNNDLREDNLLSLSYGKIKRKDINSNGGLLPESFNGYNIIEDGDIVLRLTDLQNDHTSLRVGLATERGIITSAYTTLRPIKKETSKYLYYLLHSFDIKKGFYGMGSGVRQGLNYDEVKELRVILPSDNEQGAIVRYLDDQCAKIDSLIEETKASIENYKAWRSSVIFEATTRGIHSEAKMKSCILPAIVLIPSHWTTDKIKNLATCNDETLSDNTDANYSFDYIDIGSVKYGEGITTFQPYFFKDSPSRARRIVKAGDVIVSTVRTYLKAVALIPEHDKDLIVSTGFAVFRAANIDSKFLYYAVLSDKFISTVEANSVGMSYPAINAGSLISFKIPLPPLHEQKEIADYLDNKCFHIDALIKEKVQLIQNLVSYKKSLIYEVVTGKQKVV